MARRKNEEIEIVKKAPKKKVENTVSETVEEKVENTENSLDVHIIYHKGDNLEEIAKTLTGHAYMMYRLLESNGYTTNNIPDGAILKWKV